MNANRKYLKRSLMALSILLLTGAIIAMMSGASVQSVQAAPKKTKTPTRTPRPIYTPTQTLTPFVTPTPGPTCWSVVPAPAVPGYGAVRRDWGTSAWGEILVPRMAESEARALVADYLQELERGGVVRDEDVEGPGAD